MFRAAELSTENAAAPSSRAKETNVLLVLRTVANVLQKGTKIGDGIWIKEVSHHDTWFYNSFMYCSTRTDFRNSWKHTI